MKNNYPIKKKTNFASNNDKQETANLLEDYDNVEVLVLTKGMSKDEWIMDSGCTFHMTPIKDWFLDLEHINGGIVLMSNDKSCEDTCVGAIKFKLVDGSIKILSDVRLVPKLRRNLISLGLLDPYCYTYKYKKGVLKIMKGTLVVMRAKLINGLYILERSIIGDSMTTESDKIDETLLWHKR